MRMITFSKEALLAKLIPAIKRFYATDRQLLVKKVGERAVMFRLGVRMINEFRPADVYAEYNKRENPYTGETQPKGLINLHKTTSAPDLAVFFNRVLDPNMLVIELKTSYSSCTRKRIKNDKDKLKEYTSLVIPEDELPYAYHLGCHIFLDKNYFLIVCYQEGHPYSILKFDYVSIQNVWIDHLPQEVSEDFDYHTLDELISRFQEGEER